MAAKELQAIIEAHARASARGECTALATVVKTSGSTYRRAGARMWIGADGETVGSISGGCLEDDARDRAKEVIASGQPAMIHYDTTAEGDILWGSGVGCQGVVHVLVEPLPARNVLVSPEVQSAEQKTAKDAEPSSALDCLVYGLHRRWTTALATVFRVEKTTRVKAGEFLWCAEESATGMTSNTPLLLRADFGIADAAFAKLVRQSAKRALREGMARVQTYDLPDGGEVEVFIDVIRPPQALLILGAGHDAVPLANLAGELGWRVRVADRRRAYATPERFSGASEVIHCTPLDIGTDRLPIEQEEAVVVMTHNYLQDLAILRALLPSSVGYIGLLGPNRRKDLLLSKLARSPSRENDAVSEPASSHLAAIENIPWLKPASLRRVHGPAGLDIGAEAPEQIALSILAEIEAYASRRQGGSLKKRRRPLHDIIPGTARVARKFGTAVRDARKLETSGAACGFERA